MTKTLIGLQLALLTARRLIMSGGKVRNDSTSFETRLMKNYVLRVIYIVRKGFILVHLRRIRVCSALFYCIKPLSDDIRADA
jgi:hypothetical protein